MILISISVIINHILLCVFTRVPVKQESSGWFIIAASSACFLSILLNTCKWIITDCIGYIWAVNSHAKAINHISVLMFGSGLTPYLILSQLGGRPIIAGSSRDNLFLTILNTLEVAFAVNA